MTRRGAASLRHDSEAPAPSPRSQPAAEGWQPEQWVEEQQDPSASQPRTGPGGRLRPRDLAVGTGSAPGGRRRSVPAPIVDELTGAAGDVRGGRLAARVADAAYAYERDRFEEARRILRPVVEEVPAASSARELLGLAHYRLGEWAAAVRHLEAYRTATGSYEQHPVLADCYRALRRYAEAEALWDELREASPGGDLVAEGRIVAAGCRADQGDLRGAIAVLERSARRVERPTTRHLRQWYALADLYERAGDLPRARDLFGRLAAADPEAFDVRQRLRALR